MSGEKIIVGHFSEAYPPLMDGVGQVVKNYVSIEEEKYGYDARVITSIRVDQMSDCTDDEKIIRSPMYPFPGLKKDEAVIIILRGVVVMVSRNEKRPPMTVSYAMDFPLSPVTLNKPMTVLSGTFVRQ